MEAGGAAGEGGDKVGVWVGEDVEVRVASVVGDTGVA